MTVVIKKVLEHGIKKWIHVNCPDCGRNNAEEVSIGAENIMPVTCLGCQTKFVVTWEESDES